MNKNDQEKLLMFAQKYRYYRWEDEPDFLGVLDKLLEEAKEFGFTDSIEDVENYQFKTFSDKEPYIVNVQEINDLDVLGNLLVSYIKKQKQKIIENPEDDFIRRPIESWLFWMMDWIFVVASNPVEAPFYGSIDKVTITSSNLLEYASNTPGTELSQELTITKDGKAELTRERIIEDAEDNSLEDVEYLKEYFQFDKEKIKKVFDYITHTFQDGNKWAIDSEDTEALLNYGFWNIELINDKGYRRYYNGNHLEEPVHDSNYEFPEAQDLTTLIRDELDIAYLFGFSGLKRGENIRSIYLDYKRYPERKNWDEEERFFRLFNPLYEEAITINFRNSTVDIRRTQYGEEHSREIVFESQTQVKKESIGDIRDIFDSETFNMLREMPKEGISKYDYLVSGTRTYEIKVEFELGPTVEFEGLFNVRGLPPIWSKIAEKLDRELEGIILPIEVLNKNYYKTDQPSKDGIFYMKVMFSNEKEPIYYWTNDREIQIGDYVRVPYNGDIIIGKVLTREFYYYPEAYPLPFEEVENIISKL